MDVPDKANEVQEMTVKMDYNGLTLLVSNRGVIYDAEGNELPQRTITNKQTGYENPYPYVNITYGGISRNVQVSRLVCMAFHPIESGDYEQYQVDHKDNDPKNNTASNLRWVSRKFNNSRKHTRMMKSKNYKRTSHKDEFLKAENLATGEIRFFKNGIQAAKGLGCSHVLIYNAIAGRMTTNAKGWRLKWIPRDSEEATALMNQMAYEKMKKDLLKAQKKEEERQARKELKRKQREIAKLELEKLELERKQRLWENHAVVQMTMDGEFIKEFKSVSEAIRATGLYTIRNCVKGLQDMSGGYKWMYLNDYKDQSPDYYNQGKEEK